MIWTTGLTVSSAKSHFSPLNWVAAFVQTRLSLWSPFLTISTRRELWVSMSTFDQLVDPWASSGHFRFNENLSFPSKLRPPNLFYMFTRALAASSETWTLRSASSLSISRAFPTSPLQLFYSPCWPTSCGMSFSPHRRVDSWVGRSRPWLFRLNKYEFLS